MIPCGRVFVGVGLGEVWVFVNVYVNISLSAMRSYLFANIIIFAEYSVLNTKAYLFLRR